MLGIVVADAGLPLVGSIPTVACAVVVVPLVGRPMMMGGRDIVPLPTIPLKKGSGFVPAMGLDGAMNKVGLNW